MLAPRSLLLDLLKFLGKFVVAYVLALFLWTRLLPGFMAGLTWVTGVIWPLLSDAGIGLYTSGSEVVAQTLNISVRLTDMDRIPFTAVTFLALAAATAGLRLGRRLALIALGLLILCASYVMAMSLTFESYLAQWYLNYAAQAGNASARLSFAYSPAQAQAYGGILNFWIDMGQHVLPIAVWAALTLAFTRGKEGGWARRLIG